MKPDATFTNSTEALEYCRNNKNKIIVIDEAGLMPNQRQQMKIDIFEQLKKSNERMQKRMQESGLFAFQEIGEK